MLKIPVSAGYQPVRTPREDDNGYDLLRRSWHAQALPAKDWALVWWDNLAVVFVRRDRWPKGLPVSLEYKSRLPIDPFWVEYMVKKKKIKVGDLLDEIQRNSREAGWNARNLALFKVVKSWEAGKF